MLPWVFKEFEPYRLLMRKGTNSKDDLKEIAVEQEKLKRELSNMQEEYENAKAAKKNVTAHYTTFLRQMDEDYSCYLKNAKKELEEYEASLPKPEPPKKDFNEVVDDMVDWAKKVNAKVAERKRLEEEQRRSEAWRKRDDFSR